MVWLEWTSIYFDEDEVVFAIAKDTTDRKKIELEIGDKYKNSSVLLLINSVPCSFESSFDGVWLTEEIKTDLFRINQECLLNVLNHAQADQVWVSVTDMDGSLRLCVRNNGKRFDLNRQHKNSGPVRMRERVASINGILIIEIEIGKGTGISVSIKRL